MTRTENKYLAYLRKKRSERLAGIFSALPNEDAQERVSWDVACAFKYEPVLRKDKTACLSDRQPIKILNERLNDQRSKHYCRYNLGLTSSDQSTRMIVAGGQEQSGQ